MGEKRFFCVFALACVRAWLLCVITTSVQQWSYFCTSVGSICKTPNTTTDALLLSLVHNTVSWGVRLRYCQVLKMHAHITQTRETKSEMLRGVISSQDFRRDKYCTVLHWTLLYCIEVTLEERMKWTRWSEKDFSYQSPPLCKISFSGQRPLWGWADHSPHLITAIIYNKYTY